MTPSLRLAAALALALGCSSSPPSMLVAPDGATGALAPDAGGTSVPDASAPEVAPDLAPLDPDTAPPPPDLAPPSDLTVAPDSDGILILDALKPPTIDALKPPIDTAGFRFEALPQLPEAGPLNGDARLLVPGRARLVGTHFTGCSNAVPASGNGDRWCAFTLPNKQIGLTDLWVMNVTQAIGGAAIKCDGTDANCKLLIPPGGNPALGTQLWTGQPMDGPIHPTTHRFDGDTLVFHAQADENVDQYSGPIYAWRPGWGAPRQISQGKSAYSCSAHFTAESFVCIENLTSTTPLTFDLTGGRLAAGAKLIKKIYPFVPGGQSSQWRAALTRDGSMLAFSTGGPTALEPETLYTANFDAPDQVTMVRPRVSRWSISADGTKIYYLANYNYNTMGAPAGTMTMADFPSGLNEKTLAPSVGAIQVLADGQVDKGIGFFDNVVAGKATYKIMSNRLVPTQVVTVITNIGGVLALTRDLRFLYFYKDFDQDNQTTTDGYIVRTDGSATPCTLTSTLESDQFGSPFTQNGSMVLWVDNIDQIDGVGEGWMANPEGCTGRRKFADKMDFWFLHGNDGMVYSDQATLDYSTLEVMTFPGGNTLGTPTAIQSQVNRIYGVLPDFKGLIYTVVNSPASSDGIFLYSKLPF
jgi:hypothetical protein